MSSHYIKIDKKAADWLQGLIKNTLNSPGSRPMIEAFEEIYAWAQALDRPMTDEEVLKELTEAQATKPAIVDKPKAKKNKRTKRSTQPKVDPKDPYTCVNHRTYQGKIAPRSDCDKCWSIYKLLHPMEYEQKRRTFNTRQKRLNKT